MRPLALRFSLISSCLALGLAAQDVSLESRRPEAKGPSVDDAREVAPESRYSAEPIPLQPLAFTPCVAGSAAGYPCNKVDLLSLLPLANMGGGTGSGNWGWTDPATGKEYALMGRSSGTAFVDVTDPITPIYLGNLPPHTVNSSWREIKTLGNYALIVSEAAGHGMQIFDLTRLRSVVAPPVTFTESAHYPGFGNCHNVVANEATGFVYGVGSGTCAGGLHMINMANPLAPVAAGCFSADGYTHDAQCVIYQGPDAAYYGREICFASNEDTVTIVDVTNKAAPVQLSRTTYSGVGYTHQGWLTDDQSRFLVNDVLDEQNLGHNTRTRIFNISDLNAPVIAGIFDGPNTAIDHNMYVANGHLYQANYRAGLRILNLAQVNSGILTEVAFFDTYPPSNSANFNSAWNVYPFFASGSILISDIEKGLFVVRATAVPVQPGFRLQPAAPGVSICNPGSANLGVQVLGEGGFTGPVSLSATGLPANVSAVFTPATVNAGSSSTLTLTASGASPGATVLTLAGSGGALADDKPLNLAIAVPLTAPAALTSPAQGVVFAPQQPLFTWSAPVGSTSTLEIATNPAFSPIAYSATLTGSSHVPSNSLAPGTLHYWRVVSLGGCGDTRTSAARSFTTLVTTSVSQCKTQALAIPDNNPAGVTSQLIATGTGSIIDIDIRLRLRHTWIGELKATLNRVGGVNGSEAPQHDGPIALVDRPGIPNSANGCSANDINALLDDSAVSPVEDACPPSGGARYAPNGTLTGLNTEPFAGTWTLNVADFASGDIGTLDEWCLEARVGVVPPPGQIPDALAGRELRLMKGTGGAINFSWGASCSAAATDYALYEGTLGTFTDHASATCSSGGSLGITATPAGGNRFFLVSALTAGEEGSLGAASNGTPHPRALTPCRATAATATCP